MSLCFSHYLAKVQQAVIGEDISKELEKEY